MNKDNQSYLEDNIPDFLVKSIKRMAIAWDKIDSNEEYTLWDADFCELQSDINVAEVEQLISPAQANYIRKKHLRMKEDD